jgi:hypothetical protein
MSPQVAKSPAPQTGKPFANTLFCVAIITADKCRPVRCGVTGAPVTVIGRGPVAVATNTLDGTSVIKPPPVVGLLNAQTGLVIIRSLST